MSVSPYLPFGAAEQGYTCDNAYVDFAAQLWQQDGLSKDEAGCTLYDDDLAVTFSTAESASAAKATTPGTDNSLPTEGASLSKDTKSVYQQAEVLVSRPSREWNQEFQAALDLPHGTHDDRVCRLQVLNQLSNDMTQAAEILCTRIVLDMSLPNDQKLIKAVDVGGIAGGEKYIAANLFVKFASKDISGLYGSDAAACAAAAHELKGARAYVGLDLPGIRPPLLCMVDVYGMRLLVSSVLPIGADTLVYGSADAGKTVHCNATVDVVMRQAGQMLNLAPHVVGRTPDVQQELTGPCDIEVHRGKDGRTYVLDTARVFPPDATVLAQSRDVSAMVVPPHPASGMLPTLVASTEWQAVCAQQLAVLHSVDVPAVCAAGVQVASSTPPAAAVILHTVQLAGVPAYCLSLNPEHPAVASRAGQTDLKQQPWASWLRRKFVHGLNSTRSAAGAGGDDDSEQPAALWQSSGQGRGDSSGTPASVSQSEQSSAAHGDGAYDVFTGVKFDAVTAPGFQSVAALPRASTVSAGEATADHVQDELSVSSGLMLNHRLSSLLGQKVFGTVMILMPQRGAHLHKMLRQELVQKFEAPLSSDAFTGFGVHGADHWNATAAHAARYLQRTVIPDLATSICFRETPIETSTQLERAMHDAGVNMRYLPQLLAHIKPSLYGLQVQIISAMVVRYCKQTLRMRLRRKVYEMAEQRTQLTWAERETILNHVVAQFLNDVFGLSESADVFWGCDLPLGLRSKYGDISAQFLYHSGLFPPEARISFHTTTADARKAMAAAVSLLERAEDPSLNQLQRTSLLMEHYRRMLLGHTEAGQLVPIDFRRLRAFILPHILLQEVCYACDVVLVKQVFEFFSASPASFWKDQPFSHKDIDSVKSSSTPLMDMKRFVSMPMTERDVQPTVQQPSQVPDAPPSQPSMSSAQSSMLTQGTLITLRSSADASAIFGSSSLQFAVARMSEAQDALETGQAELAKQVSSQAWSFLLPVLSSAYAAVAGSVHAGSALSTGVFRILQQREAAYSGAGPASLDSGLTTEQNLAVARAVGHLPSLADASVSCLFLLSRIDEELELYHSAIGYIQSAIAQLQARYGNSDIMCPVAMEDFDRVVSRQTDGMDDMIKQSLRFSVRYITIPRGTVFMTALVESLLRLQIKLGSDKLQLDDIQTSMLYNTLSCHMVSPPRNLDIVQAAYGTPLPLVMQFLKEYRKAGRPQLTNLVHVGVGSGDSEQVKQNLSECMDAIHGFDATDEVERQIGSTTWRTLTQHERKAALSARAQWWLNEFFRFSRVRASLFQLFHTNIPILPAAVSQASLSHDDDNGSTSHPLAPPDAAVEQLPECLQALPELNLWIDEFDFLREAKYHGTKGRQLLRDSFNTDHTPHIGEQVHPGDVYMLQSWSGVPRGTTLVQQSHSGMQAATGEFLTYVDIQQTLVEERADGAMQSITTVYQTTVYSDADRQTRVSGSISIMEQPYNQPKVQVVQELLTLFYDEETGHTGIAADALAGQVQWSNTSTPFHATHRIPCMALAGQSDSQGCGKGDMSRMDTTVVSIVACSSAMSAVCYPFASGIAMDVISRRSMDDEQGHTSSSHSRTSCILKPVPSMVEQHSGEVKQLDGFEVNVLTGSAVSRVPASTVMVVAPDVPSGHSRVFSVSIINEATRTVSDSRLMRLFQMPEEELVVLRAEAEKNSAKT